MSMLVIRDEERIARMKKISQITSTAGFVILAAGFILLFIDNPNRILFQTLALILGWLVALFFYKRSPKPEKWALIGSVILLIVYMIPHSVLGSELDYSKLDKENLKLEKQIEIQKEENGGI